MLLLALIGALLSFAKFDHCINSNFATPDVYIHACYSDISALFSARGLDHHAWPYSSASSAVEYPVLMGVVMWLTSLLAHSFISYFLINSLLIALLFMVTCLVVAKMKPQLWYLLPLSPAVIASLYINWDLWAVLTAVVAIYFFDRRLYDYSAVLLGISIATKFFPVVLFLPVALILYRKHQVKLFLRYLTLSSFTWLLINAPFIIFNRPGWLKFFTLNSERGADFGSLWYALNLLGIRTANINYLSLLLFAIGVTGYALFFFSLKETPTLASAAFIIVAVFTISSKVYSPQYVLWLTPLAILSMRGAKDRAAFWFWQGSEAIYHLAIWQYLASYSGAHFGLPAKAYAAATLLRIAATIYFPWCVGRPSDSGESAKSSVSTGPDQPQLLRFLPSEEGSYS